MHDISFTGGEFKGSYDNQTFNSNEKDILYFGANNTLYWPASSITIGACRAIFQLEPEVQGEVKAFSLNFDDDITGITSPFFHGSVPEIPGDEASWYTLDGRRLDKKPAQRGIYINSGKKVVIK